MYVLFQHRRKEKIHVLNYCILYTKYYIYIQKLFQNNSLDVYACQMQTNAALEIELKICKKNKNTMHKFENFYFNMNIYNNVCF